MRWDVDQIKAVYLNGAGRPGHSVEKICPSDTREYLLTVVRQDGTELYFPLTIQVAGSLPLTIDYAVESITCPSRSNYEIVFHIWAHGGKGKYTYYRDIEQIAEPTREDILYRFLWQNCGAAPGTFVVRSEDGQEARKGFYVNPPNCCR